MSERTQDIEEGLIADDVPAIMDKHAVAEVLGCSMTTVDRKLGAVKLSADGHPRWLRADVARHLAGEG